LSETASPPGIITSEPVPIGSVAAERRKRLESGIDEFDRVVGGGIVPGSVSLLSGAPGVGKSTVMLQVGASFARRGVPVLIASGEESREQVGLRARRIGATADGLSVTTEARLASLVAFIEGGAYPVVIIDSIQTVRGDRGENGSGSTTQIREATAGLIAAAKESGVALIVVGHVTKDGAIAGPKALEHMVDVVLTLDGDPHRNLRFLRGTKNRFGSVNETGVFEMTGRGLDPLTDPSVSLSGVRDGTAPGSVLFPAADGRRSLIVEIQALVVPTSSPQARRSVKGLAVPRVHQVLAALERHGKIPMSGREVYVSVMGGMTVTEPAADLAVAVAVASAAMDEPLGSLAAWGEVGLTGEVRGVEQARRRRAEAGRLGIERTIEGGDGRRLIAVLAEVGIYPDAGGEDGALRHSASVSAG
jgi:DNA repair protein RadA/Sms